MTKYRRSGDLEAAPMQDEVVVYHPGLKRFCVLNATAAVIWEQLAEPRSVDELVAAVEQAFSEVDPAKAEQDIEGTVQELLDLELIETT